MKRSVQNDLDTWATQERRKPLILRGARQVGKTHSITALGQDRFQNHFVTVDLEKHPDWHLIFEKDLSAKRILSELELVSQRKIVPGQTLLFIDEIQACPRALMALRYFYEECPKLHVIAAGSLMEFALGEISFPVGRVQFLNMYPLHFIEFLWATGQEMLAEKIQTLPFDSDPLSKVAEVIHQKLMEELKKYFFIGGMPEAVATYVKTSSLQECFSVHAELVHSYRQDFSKYAPRADKLCLDLVFKGVARDVGRTIKYSRLAEGFSQPTLKRAFDLLEQARVVTRVRSTSPSGLPLGALASAKKLKAILVDIGLIHHLLSLPLQSAWAEEDLLAIYQGALAEQFVGQEFLAASPQHEDGELYYWSRQEKSSAAEVDYLIVRQGKICPVEVKTGPSGRLKSLHLLMKTFPQCAEAYVLSTAPQGELKKEKIKFLPLYYAFTLRCDSHL